MYNGTKRGWGKTHRALKKSAHIAVNGKSTQNTASIVTLNGNAV